MNAEKSKWAHSSIQEEEWELLSQYLQKKSGIVVPFQKAYLFETRLSRMLAEAGAETFGEFYHYMISGRDPKIEQKIINAMVTNETLWFRDPVSFQILEEKVLPVLIGQLTAGKKSRIRIWSAAASTGQEIYSLVMCVEDYLNRNQIEGVTLADFEFVATDISSHVLEIARRGRYDSISIKRGLEEAYKIKYFVKDGLSWNLDPKIRQAVQLVHFNLLESYDSFGVFDVIFCRYVLIYFLDELKKEIIKKMGASIADDGVFFTGNYALFDLFEESFDANYYENLTYYTKRR